jgi:microsomal dipeptidase-like Zn-dependent dipeptidase
VIFDGHNDLALRVWLGEEPVHIQLENAGSVGFAGGFFALAAPGGPFELPESAPYARELEPSLDPAGARRDVEEMATTLERLDVAIVRRVEDIVPGRVNAIMHLEGAEPLAPDLSDLERWYERGLRSIGITWARRNAFGEGVPFRFPASPDTGPGLTQAGRDLVHACNLLGILVDVSHLNEAGFWDVAKITQAPIVATHSNAHALCASTRNLTDRRVGRRRRGQLRHALPAGGRHPGRRHPADGDRPAHRLHHPADRGRPRRLRLRLRGSPDPPRAGRDRGSATARRRAARRRPRRGGGRQDHPRQLAARAR